MIFDNKNINDTDIEKIIDFALKEDIGTGDITSNKLIPKTSKSKAIIVSKSYGIIAGLPIAEMVFRKLDKNIFWHPKVKDGDKIKPNEILVKIEGSHRALLSCERLALNFLQRMSGIATETSRYVKAVEGCKTKILDTRKTVPCLRLLDKYAVKMGGGTNHRMGLFDMVMIKENHIKVAGSIKNAVKQIRNKIGKKIKIEVETTNIDEVTEALQVRADIIMLDNMDNKTMKKAVEIINGKALVEASGNMTLKRIKAVADTGVDFISVGALTHSVKALDISQYIEEI